MRNVGKVSEKSRREKKTAEYQSVFSFLLDMNFFSLYNSDAEKCRKIIKLDKTTIHGSTLDNFDNPDYGNGF